MTLKRSATAAKPNLVFYGGAGAGKTTCAEYVTEEYGNERISFATLLKELAVKLWGNSAFTDRDKLQKLGTMLRELDEDVWARPVFEHIDNAPGDPFSCFVNDDCRFPNEYWGLKERGFIFVRVLADEGVRVDRLQRNGKLQDLSQLEHASETALTGLEAVKAGIIDDYTIFNNDSLADLKQDVDNVICDVKENV